MKKFLVFILILVSSQLFACGFYPLGEDLRFSFFNPNNFGYYSFSEFNYSSDSFYPGFKYPENYVFPNDKLWFDYCKGKVDLKTIGTTIDELPIEEITSNSSNEMIRYLYKTKDFEAINYIKFAKSCEYGNSWMDDPWERNEVMVLPARIKQTKKAIEFSKSCKNEQLKKRYLFLAIRMAYYNQDLEKIRTLFDDNFKTEKDKNIIYYWSLYFRTLAEKDSALCSYYASQVFANAIDKRFMISQQFNNHIPIESVLKYAKTNEEKANIYLLAGIRNHEKSLEYIKKIYQLKPNFDGLSFLLLREVNKIEDWVFTPYYSLFQPSIEASDWYDENNASSINSVLKRVETDRVYAKQVLNFINNVSISKIDNPKFWKSCKALLFFTTKDYKTSLKVVDELKKNTEANDTLCNLYEIIEGLDLVANQSYNNAKISNRLKTILIKHNKERKFIFAVGKELENLNNTTDAALLYSKISLDNYYDNAIYWKTIKNKAATYSDFYSNYFDYINVMYTPEQTSKLITDIKENVTKKDEFSKWKYGLIQPEVSLLYDLLGTKYIRQDKLSKALESFKKVQNSHWNDKYSTWERDEENWNSGYNVFDANPFYELKYTPHFIKEKDSIHLNKYTITKQLISYINKAQNKEEKERDYYYFLVANCYFNMTQYGNCWMMRRYSWTSYGNNSILEDEKEYYGCSLAKKYYLLAKSNAKSEKFKALCLRMIGRCEKNVLQYEDDPFDHSDDYKEKLLYKNKYYQDLKTKYPKYYTDLTGDCTFFEDYFNSRY